LGIFVHGRFFCFSLYVSKAEVSYKPLLFLYIKPNLRQYKLSKRKEKYDMSKHLDDYQQTFPEFSEMLCFFEQQHAESQWETCKVSDIRIAPLTKGAPILDDTLSKFAPGVSREAVNDTIANLGLAAKISGVARGKYFPVRNTAYKSLTGRASIQGTTLNRLPREKLASVLNHCLSIYPKYKALVLVRDEKICAFHSGDPKDFSQLPIHELLRATAEGIEDRFPDHEFDGGYTDHLNTLASWRFPKQRDDLLQEYEDMLNVTQKKRIHNLIPGIQFRTSDTGVSSAKVSARLFGSSRPIYIGRVLAVAHRHNKQISEYRDNMQLIFAKFTDAVEKLKKLPGIRLDYPVNVMAAVCEKLKLPVQYGRDAIEMFEMIVNPAEATAHDVYFALQEILFLRQADGCPENILLEMEENIYRSLSMNWKAFDNGTRVKY